MAIVDIVEILEVAFCQSMFEIHVLLLYFVEFWISKKYPCTAVSVGENCCHYVKYIPMYNENLNLRSGNLLLISFSFGRCLGFYNNSVGKYC